MHLTADEIIIREAILDVVDQDERGAWNLYAVEESVANEERLDFADAVIRRVRRIKQVDD